MKQMQHRDGVRIHPRSLLSYLLPVIGGKEPETGQTGGICDDWLCQRDNK